MVISGNGSLRLVMNTLGNNETYDLVPMANGWKPIRYKCVLKKRIIYIVILFLGREDNMIPKFWFL